MTSQEIFAWFSLVIAVVSYIPYLRSILQGQTKPHVFSWLVWGVLTGIAFLAQKTDGAGPGAWATGFTAIVSGVFVVLGLFKGEKNITRSDWISFVSALAIIPVWYFTSNPLLAIILVTLIDMLGFYPTFRKSWAKPTEELPFTYILSAIKFFVAMCALDHFSWITALYPASLVIMDTAFVVMIAWRKRVYSGSVIG